MTSSAGATRQVPYPPKYYDIAAMGAVLMGFAWGAYSLYHFAILGNNSAAVGLVMSGLLWMAIAAMTVKLREAHHDE